MKKLSIYLCKRRLRIAYRRYTSARAGIDCGATLADTISPSLVRLRERCNNLLNELAKIDPDNCPVKRIH